MGIAEPNATIVACSIPILRAFFRTQQKCGGGGGAPVLPRGRGPYVGSDSTGKFTTLSERANKRQSSAAFSDHTILKGGGGLGGRGGEEFEEGESPGIMRTQTFAVTSEYMSTPGGPSRPEAGGIEMLSRSAPS